MRKSTVVWPEILVSSPAKYPQGPSTHILDFYTPKYLQGEHFKAKGDTLGYIQPQELPISCLSFKFEVHETRATLGTWGPNVGD